MKANQQKNKAIDHLKKKNNNAKKKTKQLKTSLYSYTYPRPAQ
jgi:hypothetical protein